MGKTFQKLMTNLTLQFENPALEKEYISFNTHRILEKPWAYLINLIAVQIFLLTVSLDFFSVYIKTAQLGLIVFTIAIVIIRRKIQKYIEAIISIIPGFAILVGLASISIHTDELSPVNLFFQACALGAVGQVLIIWSFRFKFVLFSTIVSLICRFGVFTIIAVETGEKRIVELTFSIMIDFVCLYSIFSRELYERNSFRQGQNCKTLTPDSKTQLLFKHIPQSVLVMSQNLKSQLYVNENFGRTFLKSDPFGTFQKALATLYVYKEDFDTQRDLYKMFENSPSLSLYDFIIKAIKTQKIGENRVTAYAIYDEESSENQNFFEVSISELIWEETNAIFVLFSDITFQKQHIASKITNSGKDKLINTISHELKTPIHGILTMLTVGMQSTRDPEAISVFDICKKSTLILLSFVHSLVDLQLIQIHRLQLKPTRVHLETLIKDVASLFELHRSQKGITLIYEIAEDTPKHLYTDPERLSQVLVNLVGNAVKFTYEGGISIKVKPGTGSNKGMTYFEVEDTGVGMSEQELKRIFKLTGSTGDFEDNCKVHGAGLGLTVSNSLVKYLKNNKHEEGITCVSEHQKGSTFSFSILNELGSRIRDSTSDEFSYLFECIEEHDIDARMSLYKRTAEPSRRFDNSMSNLSAYDQEERFLLRRYSGKLQSPLSSPTLMSPTASPTFSRRKEGRAISVMVTPPKPNEQIFKIEHQHINEWVLLVDDNPLNLLVAKKILEGTGCQVQTAIHGKDAIQKALEHAKSGVEFFKLIIMDCQMPIMDGYDATKALRVMMGKGEIPECQIVALTANDSAQDIKKCQDCGMIEVFSKPLQEKSIKRIIEYLKEEK